MANTVSNADLDRAASSNHQTTARNAIAQLPVIDVSAFTGDGTAAERQDTAQIIRQACVDIGFFYITGHGFANDEIEECFDWGRRFFALGQSEKMKLAASGNASGLGFVQMGGFKSGGDPNGVVDIRERFYSSRELAPGELEDPASPAGRSQWLEDDVLPGFNAFIQNQIAKKVRLAKNLCRAFSLSLGLPEHYLVEFHDRMGCMDSLNFYAAAPRPEDKAWNFSPHTDYGCFTILAQDNSGGLEALNAEDDWIEIPPIPGTLVVNVGDLLQRWTNGVFVSSLHRVLNRSAGSRISNSFFAWANPRATISCLETCRQAGQPNQFEPVVSGKYIEDLLSQAYSTGRVGMSAHTAERLLSRRERRE